MPPASRTQWKTAAVLISGLVVASAANALVSQTPGSVAGVTFERDLQPFEVADASGRPYDLPFLGGLDVPRPQFIDIDGDRDLDLFLQEYSNELWFFENIGSADAPAYRWRSDRFQGVEIGDWFRFADINGDGLVDLLAERPFSYIRYYRNEGTAAEPQLTFVGDLRDSDGEPLFLDRQNIPALVDLDCDNRLDLFVGRVEGVVDRYEADAPNSEAFAFITERFEGIEIIGQIGGLENGPTRHGANALAFADFEGDGDADLFWGDFFEPAVLLIENIGRTCSTPSFWVDPIVLPYAPDTATSGYNAPAPVDLDLDGDLDFLMGVIGGAFNPVGTAENNLFHWERTAADRLELRTERFLDGIDLGGDALPSAGDVDGDGDIDLLVGNRIDSRAADAARLYLFTNEGTDTAPRFRQSEPLQLAEAYNLAPALGDLDADGDLDLFLGTWNQDLWYFRNEGSSQTPRWVRDEAATLAPPRLSHAAPALGDVDNDGNLDLFVGQASGRIVFYRNVGSPQTPEFELAADDLDELRGGRRSTPTLVDVDGDGLLDLVVGHEEGGMTIHRNASTADTLRFLEVDVPGLALDLTPSSAPLFTDLTGDGVPDLIAGTSSGGLRFYRGRR